MPKNLTSNLFVSLILFISCSVSHKANNQPIAADIQKHENQLNIYKNMQEPFILNVPDSLKRWIPVFRSVLVNDQKNRIIGYRPNKEEWKEQLAIDSINLTITTNYLDSFGWPQLYKNGSIVTKAVGTVIQHAPLGVQEKYFPMLVEAYEKNHILFENLALMEDRINIRHHRYQYYGTQLISYKGKQQVYPLVSVDSLEVYRKKIGFPKPYIDYMKIMKLDWDTAAYKQMLPELIIGLKVSDSAGLHYSPKQ